MDRVLKGLHVLNKAFNEGIKVAKVILNVCIVGAMATAHLIGSLFNEESLEESLNAEPP